MHGSDERLVDENELAPHKIVQEAITIYRESSSKSDDPKKQKDTDVTETYLHSCDLCTNSELFRFESRLSTPNCAASSAYPLSEWLSQGDQCFSKEQGDKSNGIILWCQDPLHREIVVASRGFCSPGNVERNCIDLTNESRRLLSASLDAILSATVQSEVPDAIQNQVENVVAYAGMVGEINKEAIEIILHRIYSALQDEQNIGVMKKQALMTISSLCRNNCASIVFVAQSKGIQKIVDLMSRNRGFLELQEHCVSTLTELTRSRQARKEVVAAKGAESIIWAMKEFQSSCTLQLQGCTALCNISFQSVETKKRIGKIGGFDAIAEAMKNHVANDEIQLRGCLALQNLTYAVKVNQWIAGRSFCVEVVMTALNTFTERIDLVCAGYTALLNIRTDERDNTCRVPDNGALEQALRLLKTKANYASLVMCLFFFLSEMCAGDSENQVRIGNADGTQVILSCLSSHITHPLILRYGCTALRHLFFVQQNRLRVKSSFGGLEVLVRVMWEGGKYFDVAESALSAVANGTYDVPESKRLITTHGGIPAVVGVMALHIDRESVQEHGCRALRNLSDSDDLSLRILEDSGAIETAICSMNAYPESTTVQEHACALLFNMANSERNARQMREKAVPDLAKSAMELIDANENLRVQAGALMLKLSSPFRRNSSDNNHPERAIPLPSLGIFTKMVSSVQQQPHLERGK